MCCACCACCAYCHSDAALRPAARMHTSLRARPAGVTPARHTARTARRVRRWLVAKGLNINSTTYDGTSAFHWAVWQGHMHVCKWMVYLGGCDFASTNSFGCNAVQWAAQTDNLAMCRWLAAIGLDIRVINANGHSAVHKAAGKGQRGVCAWLLNEECLGAEHMRADGDGNTPAVMARLEGYTALAEDLDAAALALSAAVASAAGGRGGAAPGPFGRGAAEVGGEGAKRGSAMRQDVGLCTRLARLRQLAGEVGCCVALDLRNSPCNSKSQRGAGAVRLCDMVSATPAHSIHEPHHTPPGSPLR